MRKLGLLTTLCAALLLPLNIFALGLGEIEVSSFLNQPLKAEITVVSARAGEIDNLLVSLASRDAFLKAGLERPSDLSKLRFKVEKSEDGTTARILVSTKSPVKEPFLNFLVEADWARGRLLREFTVLLDPPYFSQQAATTAPQVTAEQAPTETAVPVQEQPIATRTEPDLAPAPVVQTQFAEQESYSQPIRQPIAQSGTTSSAEEIPYVADNAYLDASSSADDLVVSRGDTLWGITKRFKDEEHSIAQVMLALQTTNPDAFGQDNINNLKVGSVLRAPDQGVLDSLSKQEAYAQVLEQNGLWDDYVARKTGDAFSGSPVALDATTSDIETDETGQLSLLAPGDSDSSVASLQNEADDKADSGQIRKQLALAEEELEAARLENNDLQSRIADLEIQLGKFEELQKLVQIEDDSLAQLQDRISEDSPISEQPLDEAMIPEDTGEQMESMELEPALEELPSDIMIEAADEIMSEQLDMALDQPESQDMMMGAEEAESMEAETLLDTIPEELDEMFDETISDEEMVDQDMTGPSMLEQEFDEQESTAPAPVIVTETPTLDEDGGLLDMLPALDDMLADPVLLGGIGAVLLLLLGLIFVKRKKSTEEDDGITLEEPEELDDLVDDDPTPIHVPTVDVTKTDEDVVGQDDTGIMDTEQYTTEELSDKPDDDDFASTEVLTTEQMPAVEVEETAVEDQEQDDVLNEVDVYLAYGLYDNAEDLLKESLEHKPDRADYRAKLLDTYYATQNSDSFVREAEALKSLGSGADRYWDRIQIMGFELAPDNELFVEAKDSDISVVDLEYAKPDSADFDIGSDEDITDFSNTDFDLGEETFEMPDTQVLPSIGNDDFSVSQNLQKDDDIQLSDLETDEADVDLPDAIGEFDFSLEEESAEISDSDEKISEDILDFNLPDNLDLSTDAEEGSEPEQELIELEPTVEAKNLDVVPPTDEEIDDNELDLDELEDTDLQTEIVPPAEPAEEEAEAPDDDITEFEPGEETNEFAALIDEAEQEAEAAATEVDMDAGVEKTGTFAPGDFIDEIIDAEDANVEDAEDIEGLMLPDDVDEVGTKLDLAKAFIDMGDAEGAKSSLEEVLTEGTEEQQAEAKELLQQIK